MSVYLCHKCSGHLGLDAGLSAYACGCISGYVRDWQLPVPASEVRSRQLAACQDTARLYACQGRDPKSDLVVWNNALLAKLSGSDAS
jgi:hypothetical protein